MPPTGTRRRLTAAAVSCALTTAVLSGCAATGVVDAGVPSAWPATSAALGSSLIVGDCVDGSADTLLRDLRTAECASEHDWEVYAIVDIPVAEDAAGEYPGDDHVTAVTDAACAHAFQPFAGVSYDESALDYTAVIPDATDWADGHHRAACLIGDPAGAVTGTLDGTGR
jgi:Septum formation